MKIKKVQIYDVELARAVTGRRNPVIVKILTDEQIDGVGEIGLAYAWGAKAGVKMIQDFASDFLINADPRRVEHLWDTLFRRTFWGQGGGPVVYGAISAIDEALWDIKGKMLGVPVYELLGGKVFDRIRVYANGWADGRVKPEEYAEGALKVVADGYTALKFDPVYATPDGRWDPPRRWIDADRAKMAYARVKAVRDAVGPDIDLLIEASGTLGTTAAIQLGKRLEPFTPFLYEEPVDPMNVECMKKVSDHVNIPIAAGERLYTRYQFRQLIEKQAVDIIQPDLGLAGGLTEVKKIASHAETYNLHIQPHYCGAPVAGAASVQLDACTTNFVIQEVFPYRTDDRYNMVEEPVDKQVKNGFLQIPDKPGLGVQLNSDYLKRFACIEVE